MTDSKLLSLSLESFIDANSLQDALQLLSEICWQKANHVQSNWQDSKLATVWEHAGTAIDKLSIKDVILTASAKSARRQQEGQ
jgi:hypothetical protein